MPRIVFIEPKSPNLHIFSQFPLPRLGVFILGTLAKERGWDAEVVIEQTGKIDFEILRSADLVGISTITSTAPRAYAIADRLRKWGVTVIMGGPHVTFLADEALDHGDYVVRAKGRRRSSVFSKSGGRPGFPIRAEPFLAARTEDRPQSGQADDEIPR